jgi:hypothetical protein
VDGERIEVLGDLRRQLACRGEDERARGPARLVNQAMQDRQQKRGRLPAAGLRAGQQVFARKRGRNRLGLNRCRAGEPELANALQKVGMEVERRERHPQS